jgi:hypothetical protein
MSTLVSTTYTAAGIIFAKDTAANRATALTLNAAADSLTDVFTPVTLATGKITSASTSTTAIGGTATAFLTDFDPGDFLFYYTAGASPILLGKIASIASDTSITLTEDSPVAIGATPGAYCGKTNTVISAFESIIMRIPVVPINSTLINMPNWNSYRESPPPPVASSNNLDTYSNMESYSKINNPSQITNSVVNVPYTIKPLWNYSVFPLPPELKIRVVFATTADFPNYAYALLDPYGNSTVQNLAANTLYKMFANERFLNNGIQVGINYPYNDLKNAGY